MSEVIIPVKYIPHNGKPITKLEVSPNGEYLVTYSEKDHSIVGWNVNPDDNQDDEIEKESPDEIQRIDEGQLEPAGTPVEVNEYMTISQLCVSDDKKLGYIYIDD